MTNQLGKYLGSFKSEAIPLLAGIAIRLGWLKHRYARYYVSDLEVYEEGICLKALKAGGEDRTLRYGEIRRVWYERYPAVRPMGRKGLASISSHRTLMWSSVSTNPIARSQAPSTS